MKRKDKIFGIILGFCLLISGGTTDLYGQQPLSNPSFSVDPELCALMLRKGKESFSRARYGEAKGLFRKAVQADPTSQTAWSYYDLAQMYAVAEQFKNHGRLVQSSAPAPEQTADLIQPQPVSPSLTPPSPAKDKEKAGAVKKDKASGKEKTTAPAEIKKPEPPKPAPGSQPAAPSVPAPSPTKPPGGAKILHDEGC